VKSVYMIVRIITISLLILGFSITSQAKNIQIKNNVISIAEDLEEEEQQVDEDLYHGDEEQNLQYDEQQNEFINGSEEDEIDQDLTQEEEDLEYKEQTEDDIDTIEEEINEQP